MNFFDVTLIPEGDGTAVMLGATRLAMLPQSRRLPAERRAVAGVRPERFELTDSPVLTAKIEVIEPTGLGQVLHLDVFGLTLKAFRPERLAFRIGDTVGLRVPPDALLLFEPDGGKRIRAAV